MPLPDGFKGNPRFDLDNGSDFPGIVTELSDWMATVADRAVSTLAQRDAITPKWGGMQVYVGDLKILYVWTGTEYITVGGVEISGTLGHASGIDASDGEFLYRSAEGWVDFYWSGTYLTNINDGATIGSVPVGFRPPAQFEAAGLASIGDGANACLIHVLANGTIRVFSSGGNRKISFSARYRAA